MDTVHERPIRREEHSPEICVKQVTSARVFVHHDGALGDVLLSLPCLQRIRVSSGFLHLACRTDIGELLQHAGLADEISRVDSLLYSQLYADLPGGWSCGTLSSFDRAYLFIARATRFADNLKQCIPDVRVIRTIPPADAPERATLFRLRQCGDDEFADSVPLSLPEADRVWAERLLAGQGFKEGRDRLLIVHPGSGGVKKCWPLKNYLDLIRSLSGYPQIWCVVLSGPAEPRETISDLQELASNDPHVVHLHQEPLSRVAALLNIADYYLGNDSGISHLAGAMHCQGTVLFGPTDPQVWRPFCEGIEAIQFTQEGEREPVTALRLRELILSALRSNRQKYVDWNTGRIR